MIRTFTRPSVGYVRVADHWRKTAQTTGVRLLSSSVRGTDRRRPAR